MKLLNYILGSRRGENTHFIEYNVLTDLFLADDNDAVGINQANIALQLQANVWARTASNNKNSGIRKIVVAAVSFVAIMGVYSLLINHRSSMMLVHPQDNSYINLYFPQAYVEQKGLKLSETEAIPLLATNTVADISYASVTQGDASETFDFQNQQIQGLNINEDRNILSGSSSSGSGNSSASVLANKNKKKEILPQPVSGYDLYNTYIKENKAQIYDPSCKTTTGVVILSFDVNSNGRPTNVIVEQGLCNPCNDEAIRLLNDGCDWTQSPKRGELKIYFNQE